MGRLRFVLLLLAALAVGAACSAPTEPRVPTPGEEPKQPPPDTQG